MAIFRGIGGAGDSTTDATVTAVTEQATNAANSATAAASSASSASTSASAAAASASSASSSETNATSSAANAATSASNASSSASSANTAATNAAASETAAGASETASAASESAAATSASNAASSASSASSSASTATTKASEASASASAASTSASNAATSASNAAASESAASTSEGNAATSETNAANSATAASGSASSASSSASAAAGSASAASTSATNAAASETAAAASETAAGVSEANAATSESNAATSASNAATSESNASTSASNAATSASTATTKAGEASTSATNAASSASAASSSASAASASETAAAASQSAAATSASNAATSETNAASSASTATTQAGIASSAATTATTQASNASTSASNAATSASNAASSASSAASSASSASASADAALAALDSFDDRYLGQKASAPTLDNDGNALIAGALYFNTTTNEMKVYDGSTWLNAYASLSGALLATNNLSDLNNLATARTNLGLAASATTDTTNASNISSGTLDAARLADSGVTASTYGDANNIPQITVDAKGRLTGVSNTAVNIPSGSLTFTGDVTGTGTTGSSTTLTLANSGVTANTYGSSTAIPSLVIDAKGRVTSASTNSISVGNGTLTLNTSGTGISGSQTFTANQAGNATFTVTSNATNLNTASTVVARDASGNFSAGTITANLSGNATTSSSTSGNAATATKLATARTIGLTGDVSGSASFDGSANATITAVVADDSHNHVISNVDGLQTALNGKQPLDGDLTAIGGLAGTSGLLRKTAANTWSLDTAAYSTTTGTVTSVSGTGSYGGLSLSGTVTGSGSLTFGGTPSGTWPISVSGSSASTTGNANTATTLQTARTINGVSFNGSANITVEPYVEDAVTTSVTRYVTFVDNSTAGYKRLNEDANFTYNPGTNVLSVPTFSGALSGNATTATTLQTARTINGVSFNGSANITVESYVEDDNSTNATRYLTFVDNSTASFKRLNEDSSLTYNPGTNVLSVPDLNVNSIGDVSGGTTTTINGFTPTVSNMAGRNRIINGDMRIDQRNAGAAIVPITPNTYTVDRLLYNASQSGKFNFQQNAFAGTGPEGFPNYAGFVVASAYTAGAAEFFSTSQRIEGFNISDLGWGTAAAKTVTLSFWVQSSLTGLHSGALVNSSFNRSYPYGFTVSAANTWEFKTITIPGDTSGTWDTTNGMGIGVTFNLGGGSDYLGTANAWAAANKSGVTGAISVVGTSGATFYITGVQLEAGSVATPFERRSFGTELQLAQRYFSTSLQAGASIQSTDNLSVTQTGAFFVNGQLGGGAAGVSYPVPMRAAPSVTIYAPLTTSAAGKVRKGVDGFIFTNGAAYFIGNQSFQPGGGDALNTFQYGWAATAEL